MNMSDKDNYSYTSQLNALKLYKIIKKVLIFVKDDSIENLLLSIKNMAGLPPPAKVAGAHTLVYENYYKMVDPRNEGKIEALEAAKFLKKSNLSDTILSEIWDIADLNSRGYLDKSGMFVALKLCALAQQGHRLNPSDIFMDIPPPKMEDESSSSWKVSSLEQKKYEQLFLSLEPINGYIPGNKVKGVLMDSKLPLETLGKIWDLADIDSDGRLNLHEFIIAMHLVYKALEKNAVPNVLPPELSDICNSNLNDNSLPLNTISTANWGSSEPAKTLYNDEWVVSYEDQLVADKLFEQTPKHVDGFLSGSEIKYIFIQSGLPQTDLAHIWNLCDISQTGKLNNEQFALSMWLIKQKLSGSELPNKLTNKMIPPSFRKNNCGTTMDNNNVCTFTNPELNMLSREIADVTQEKHIIEQEISQKEADIQIKMGQIKSLESELDSLTETLRQLENQKEEAQKGLHDLKSQVQKLRQDTTEQESTLKLEEDELHSRRQVIKSLKLTEQNLESHELECKGQLNKLFKQLQNKQLQISKIKAKSMQLEEQQHRILDATAQLDAALAVDDATMVPESSLLLKVKLDESMYTRHILNSSTNKAIMNDQKDAFVKNYLKNEKSFGLRKNEQVSEKNRNLFEEASPTVTESIKDPFGDGPFAGLQTLPQSDSPGPALPPKQSRLPPPRPAPRRPVHGPITIPRSSAIIPSAVSQQSTRDPFGDKSKVVGDEKGTSDFADFANFDSTCASITDDFAGKCKVDENIKSNPSVSNSVFDFDEDPFANYRYEDLSMISDPFSENNQDLKGNKSKVVTKNQK